MGKVYVNQDSLIILARTGINFSTYSATVFKLEYKTPSATTGQWSATTTATLMIDGTLTALSPASGPVVCRLSATSQLSIEGDWKFQPKVTFADGSHARGETFTVHIYGRFK